MIEGIAQLALIVDSYEKAIEFYCAKLGLRIVEDTPLERKRWIRLQAPGGEGSEILLSLATNPQQEAAIGNQAGGRVLFFLHTTDLLSDYERLRKMGIEFTELPCVRDYGKVAVFKDLYGNRIDLIEAAITSLAKCVFTAGHSLEREPWTLEFLKKTIIVLRHASCP